jgi:hypothetical protein
VLCSCLYQRVVCLQYSCVVLRNYNIYAPPFILLVSMVTSCFFTVVTCSFFFFVVSRRVQERVAWIRRTNAS